MTQEEIIGMAREVGAPGWWSGESDGNVPGMAWLSRFAALVAAKAAADEREALLKIVKGPTGGDCQSSDWWSGYRVARNDFSHAISRRTRNV